MSETIEIFIPDIGDFKNVPVIEVSVQPGEMVTAEQTLIVVESDKSTMDVPVPIAGRITELKVKLGDTVSRGSLVALLEPTVGTAPSAAVPQAPTLEIIHRPVAPAPPVAIVTLAPPPAAIPRPTPVTVLPHASPSVRRLARELGVGLGRVTGSGPKTRITNEDLHAYVKAALAAPPTVPTASVGLDLLPWPKPDFSKFGPTERVSLSKIKRISGANLSRNSIVIPHVTNFDEADVTELEAFRTEANKQPPPGAAKLTMLAFMIKATVGTLRKHPDFNASLDGEELILKRYFHIGFAADTPNGLVVPVIKDADRKGLFEIATEAGRLAGLAREGKLKADDMQGGCFTISSLGGVGGNGFTPIINAPEVAILGAARAKMQPFWTGKEFIPRLIMPVSLSWDHRVIDGAEAARYLVTFTGLMADFRRISL
jgi:pyruvate dehydrogenase E2 component (dihydrolipoamide acetyltransferase)